MDIQPLLTQIELLCDEADKLYPTRDDRPTILRELKAKLQQAEGQTEQLVALKSMEGFIRGGQGSFYDISLNPPPGSNKSHDEIDKEFRKFLNPVYSGIEQLIIELS